MRRVQNTSSSFAKRTSSATRRVYVPLEEEKNASFISILIVVDFNIAFKSKPGLIELRRQDTTVDASRPRPRASEPDFERGHHPRAPSGGPRARAASRETPSHPAHSREPRNHGRVFLRSPACLVFHFCFSGSGRARGAERQRNVPALCRPAGDVRASHPGGRGAPSRRTQGKPLLKKKKES